MPQNKNKNLKGFTFIEALTMLFIFSLITITFYNVIMVGTRYIVSAKNRLGAVALAGEKIEIARNLKYADVGVVLGDCPGTLKQDEYVTENGKTYLVHTHARYVDDPFDGKLGESPNDLAYHDYKELEITVSWNNGGSDQGSIMVSSDFMSPSLEVVTAGDGILSINVFSDQAGGAPVIGASVHVVDSAVGIDEFVTTDIAGNVMLLGAKESLQKYQITVSKSGYETVTTFPPYPATAYNPIDTYATVIGGNLNTTNIVENKLANLKISTVDYLGDPVADVGISLKGGRKLGTEFISPFDPVYNLVFDGKTDTSGEKDFGSISPGQYTFGPSPSESTYELIGTNFISPLPLASEGAADIKLKVADKNKIGILIKVANSADASAMNGATVELKNVGLAYDETVTTGADGMAFFPISAAIFQAGTYDLTVKADGFNDNTKTETIIDNILSIDNVSMIAN